MPTETIPQARVYIDGINFLVSMQGCRSAFWSEGAGDEWQAPTGCGAGG